MLDVSLILVQVLVIVSLPFVISHAGEALMHRVAHHEFAQVPVLTTMARLQGMLLAGMLLYVNFDGSYYDLQTLFLPESRWNLTFQQFLFEQSNPLTYRFWPLTGLLGGPFAAENIVAWLALVVLPVLLLLLSLRFWSTRLAVRAMLACAIATFWSAWLTIYLVCLVFWSFYILNFWSLALMALYLQYRRSH
jgi:hypothetical protein